MAIQICNNGNPAGVISVGQVLKLADGSNLIVPDSVWEHIVAHKEVTREILTTAVAKCTPRNLMRMQSQNHLIDLAEEFGLWGHDGLVKTEKVDTETPILVGFRKNRKAPSRVIDQPPIPTSFLRVVFKPSDREGCKWELVTAFPSGLIEATMEPITPAIDPQTEDGWAKRQECLNFWSSHALCISTSELDGEPFTSTWKRILDQYGDVYHQ